MSWNRTYRPRLVADLHLDAVREELQTLLRSGTFPQVFIFAGSKGTGKTSASRILGALLNNPKNEAQVRNIFFEKKKSAKPLVDELVDDEFFSHIFTGSSYTVQEMDAASNRGIDDVRLLKERAFLPPQAGLMSVFILDEAHMLTTEAFNALLKLLEEPPAHTLFILATTELHKIPGTIVSRAHLLQFNKATIEELSGALTRILDIEHITYEPAAVEQIAAVADGSFRDAVKTAEMVAANGKLTQEMVSKQVTGNVNTVLPELVAAVVQKDMKAVVAIFARLRQENSNEVYVYKALLTLLHQSLKQNLGLEPGEPLISIDIARFLLTELNSSEVQAPSPISFLGLEMKLLDIIARAQKQQSQPEPSKKKASTLKIEPTEVIHQEMKLHKEQQTSVTAPIVDSVVSTHGDGESLIARWQDFVNYVAEKNSTIAALLRSAQPINGRIGAINIRVYYTFHQEQLASKKFNHLIQICAQEFLGSGINFTFFVEEPQQAAELQDIQDYTSLTTVVEQALM